MIHAQICKTPDFRGLLLLLADDTINRADEAAAAGCRADITSNNKMLAFRRLCVIFTVFLYCAAEDVCVSDGDGDCGTTAAEENKYLEGLFEWVVVVVRLSCDVHLF